MEEEDALNMPITISPHDLEQVTDRASLFAFLHRTLGWPLEPEDTFTYEEPLLGGAIPRVQVSRIPPFSASDPFLLLLAEWETPLRRTELREILRAVRARIRTQGAYGGRALDDIVFVCPAEAYGSVLFAHFEEREGRQPRLEVFGWEAARLDATRTLREFNLPALALPALNSDDEPDWTAGYKRWLSAWDVHAVTNDFYEEYDAVFKQVEGKITGVAGDKRIFTQRLFNRLMFIQFLSKKRWLWFGENKTDYLEALWEGRDQSVSFYTAHLCPLFFSALNNPHIHRDLGTDLVLRSRIGHVPYLNGGLFHKSDDEVCGESVPNDAFDLIINKLFSKFNFTVHESTPLDIDVAVDPEMLGKVFEELVTGRHESGSYYTPRPVVAFMCKEALKGYLGGYDALIDHHNAGDVTVPQAKELLRRLAEVKVVDPACGSGAYLLGMLQELFALNRILDTRAEQATARDDYKRKLDIIRNNIYGVDLDEFAVQIARLRLWLSLAVEYEGEVPEPLPNLDFKVEQGDSLSAPDPQGGPTADIFRQKDIEEFSVKKAQYADPYYKGDKKKLKDEIKKLRDGIAVWAHPNEMVQGFDWRVEFAEVFEPQEPLTDVGGAMNLGGTLTEARLGGFDIALQNPPYVRQEEIKNKPHLQKLYAEGVDGKSDLYCYFYLRSMQILQPGGIQIFIVSNSWLDVGYGGKLQKYLLEHGHVQTIYDSAVERQFATADINTIISAFRKGKPANGDITRFVSLRASFEQALADPEKRRELTRTRAELWEAGLGDADKRGKREYTGDKWGGKYLRAPDVYWTIMERGKDKMTRLGDIADVRRGFTTGANDFFYVRVLNIDNGIAHIRCDDGSEHTMEAEYVTEPVLVKAREIVRPRVLPSDLAYRLVQLDEDAEKKPHAGKYIRWGEASRKDEKGNESGQFHLRPTCASRHFWFKIEARQPANVLTPLFQKRRAAICANEAQCQADCNLCEIIVGTEGAAAVTFSLVSTFGILSREILGRANLGQGVLKTQIEDLLKMPVVLPTVSSDAVMQQCLKAIGNRTILMVYDDVRRDDRKTLDDAFLHAVGFTDPAERADVLAELHDAACRRVWERQAKAEKTREARQTYDDWLASGLPFGNVDEE